MIENYKKEIDLEIAKMPHDPKSEGDKLKINQDTSYDIFYDIYIKDEESYFYIKMIENTANAPFYYIRSYTIQDLYKINKIFKVFENDNFGEIKNYMKKLFEKNKIQLKYEQNEDIINMQLNVILFANEDKINFELYREMIPYEEQDEKLLDLYNQHKNKNKLIKEIKLLLNNFNGNQKDQQIINYLNNLINSKIIPGIEYFKEEEQKENIIIKKKEKNEIKEEIKEQKIIIEKNEINAKIKEEIKEENLIIEKNIDNLTNSDINNSDLANSDIQILVQNNSNANEAKVEFTDLKGVYIFSKANGNFNITFNIKNISDEDWPLDSIKLVYNDEKSQIRSKTIVNCMYEIDKGQDGDFVVCFDEKEIKLLKSAKKYKCYMNLYLNENKITNEDIIFKVKVVE